ncbi:hypothetical protein TWF696_001722 [Orbilia brochopaga]|uniref:Uncharacterized protein n=1 Tax=Orbilia brochopaga TaxID=3140254 RepID=A0AAV9U5L0_9PEZI
MMITNLLLFASLTVFTGASRPRLPAVSPRAPAIPRSPGIRAPPDTPNAAPGPTVRIEVPVSPHPPPDQAVIDARPAGVQSSLNIPGGVSCSTFIPFTNVGSGSGMWPDESGPRVYLDVDGVDVYRTPPGVIVDTGSVRKETWTRTFRKTWATVVQTPANRGWKYLSSSDLLYTGYWAPVNITLKNLSGKPLVRAPVRVLVYDAKIRCDAAHYAVDNGVCVGGGVPLNGEDALVGAYLGVGYGRRGDGMGVCTPDVNPLFNVRGWWTVVPDDPTRVPTARCNYRNGYIVTRTGIIWGLTARNTADFKFH